MSDGELVHVSIMVNEVLAAFHGTPPGSYVDATLGRGGHARAVLEAHPDRRGELFDRDIEAINQSRTVLAEFESRIRFHHERFDHIGDALDRCGVTDMSIALFDLGESSPQLDDPTRGFSHRQDGPLDMRMDQSQTGTAADLVNLASADELERILHRYGDERFARRIARSIVAGRPIHTTTQLVEVVKSAIPARSRRTGGHPATRTFQALRIAVNSELEILAGALDSVIARLVPGGRLAVLSFHSGEDRIVKQRFNAAVTGGCTCPPALPCGCGAISIARPVRSPKKPTANEIAHNPRARSTRLRVIEATIPTPRTEVSP